MKIFFQRLKLKDLLDSQDPNDDITNIEFNNCGNELTVTTKSGNLIVLKEDVDNHMFWKVGQIKVYKEVHDWRKNLEIPPVINSVHVLEPVGKARNYITTSSNSIKVIKVQQSHKKVLKITESEIPEVVVQPDSLILKHAVRQQFPNLHDNLIVSTSLSSNGEYLLSHDGFKAYLWNVQCPITPYHLIDNKRPAVNNTPNTNTVSQIVAQSDSAQQIVQQQIVEEDQDNEQDQEDWESLSFITSLKFHSPYDNCLAYSTKTGKLLYFDMRNTTSMNPTVTINNVSTPCQFESQFKLISDFAFLNNGYNVVTRDYLSIKNWDLRMPAQVVSRTNVYPSLLYQICNLWSDNKLYDQFEIAAYNNKIATTHYEQTFHEIDLTNGTNYRIGFNQELDEANCMEVGPAVQSDHFDSETHTEKVRYNRDGVICVATSKHLCLYR